MKPCSLSKIKKMLGPPSFYNNSEYICDPKTCYRIWTLYKYSWNCELAPTSWSIGEIQGRYCDAIEWLKKNDIWIDYVPHPSGDSTYLDDSDRTIKRFQISLPDTNKKD